MASQSSNSSQNWKTPNELIKLHRLKQKKKQLTARLKNNNVSDEVTDADKQSLLEAVVSQKRKNPFARVTNDANAKKQKTVEGPDLQQDDSLIHLINSTETKSVQRPPPAKLVLQPFDPLSFAKLLHQPVEQTDEDAIEEQKFSKHLPMDWSLKTRLRVFCQTALPATNLKTSQEASGLTSFVRCMDPENASTGLDISPAARLNQGTYYWQHPHLPWMTLFPRNSKANTGIQVGERERVALSKDWSDSFRGLFQLVRARQCPFFYMCANGFTVLFRAAGIGGRVETHALMTPTSRGMRSSLKQEGIEFGMPFRKDFNLNKSGDGSFTEDQDTQKSSDSAAKKEAEEEDEDDLEDEEWLESLGVDQNEIKKISSMASRQKLQQEMAEDFSDNSLVLIEGVECQAFFNFLLNAKSTITGVGRLAGIPPTLLAPVAFPKATMQNLTTRSSKVRMDGVDYFSVELKGVILPHVLPFVSRLLAESKDTFSATFASSNCTLAFSKASQKLIGDNEKENSTSDQVFGKENLSDCGLHTDLIEAMCRVAPDAVSLMERVCFSKEFGYCWS